LLGVSQPLEVPETLRVAYRPITLAPVDPEPLAQVLHTSPAKPSIFGRVKRSEHQSPQVNGRHIREVDDAFLCAIKAKGVTVFFHPFLSPQRALAQCVTRGIYLSSKLSHLIARRSPLSSLAREQLTGLRLRRWRSSRAAPYPYRFVGFSRHRLYLRWQVSSVASTSAASSRARRQCCVTSQGTPTRPPPLPSPSPSLPQGA